MNEKLKLILTILIVVAVGMLAINQILGLYYRSQLLLSPCDLCSELNPHLNKCFEEASNVLIDPSTNKIVGTNITIDLDNFTP